MTDVADLKLKILQFHHDVLIMKKSYTALKESLSEECLEMDSVVNSLFFFSQMCAFNEGSITGAELRGETTNA